MVCYECNHCYIWVRGSSFFSKNWEFSTTMRRPDYEPYATFVKYFAFRLSSNSNKGCCIRHLLTFDPFKRYSVMFWVQLINCCILRNVFCFRPVKTALSFDFITAVSSVNKLVECYCICTHMALTPLIYAYCTQVVSCKIIHSNAIENFANF